MSEIEQLRQQLVDLQSQFAFHEDTVNSLNGALAEQQKEILTLQRQVSLLKQQQDEQAMQLDQSAPAANEKPPHY